MSETFQHVQAEIIGVSGGIKWRRALCMGMHGIFSSCRKNLMQLMDTFTFPVGLWWGYNKSYICFQGNFELDDKVNLIYYLAATGRGTRFTLSPPQTMPGGAWLLPTAVTPAQPCWFPQLRGCLVALQDDQAGAGEGANHPIVSGPLITATVRSCRGPAARQTEQFFNFVIKTEIRVDSAENVKDWRTAINFEADNHTLAP